MQKLSEELAVVGTIDPQTITVTEIFSDVVDMSKWNDVMCVFAGGNMAANGSMICRAVTCTSDGGNVAALKTASTVSVGTDNTQVVVEVTNEDLAGGNATTGRYIKFGFNSAGDGGPVAAIVLARGKFLPSS